MPRHAGDAHNRCRDEACSHGRRRNAVDSDGSSIKCRERGRAFDGCAAAEAFLASAKEAEVHGGGMRLAGTAPSQTYVGVPAVAKEEPATSLMSPGALAAATSPRHLGVKGLGTRCCATAETWQAKLRVDN
jgi:hypothetical protein